MPNPIDEITKAMAGFRVIAEHAQSMPQAPDYYVRFLRATVLRGLLDFVVREPIPEPYLAAMLANGYERSEAADLYHYVLSCALSMEPRPAAITPNPPTKEATHV
jgi:hypothetical protein